MTSGQDRNEGGRCASLPGGPGASPAQRPAAPAAGRTAGPAVEPPADITAFTAADYAALEEAAREVLDFWFGEPGSIRFGKKWDRWFQRNAAFDAMLRERFFAVLAAARRGECDGWERSPLGALAQVVVLDQFSRNIHRGTAEAFAGDAQALAAARKMVDSGADLRLPSPQHRAFVYLPFEHAESIDDQRRSVQLFDALERETGVRGYVRSAHRHAEIIERFGRFPHRNATLGRESTDEERAFLLQPGSSF
jgi:uncharacterized protein (DUF924 family)